MSKMKSFIKQFIAKVQGDDATVQAEKAYRSANAALKLHIGIAEADLLNAEDAVEKATEKLANARINNGQVIEDRDVFIENLTIAKNELTEAEDALETHKEYIAFLKQELDFLNS